MSTHRETSIDTATAPTITTLPALDGKSNWSPVLLGAVIFIGGIVVGAAGSSFVSEEEPPEPDAELILREDFPEIMAARVQQRFDLSDKQRDQAREIFARYVPRMREVRQKIEPEMMGIVVPLSVEITDIMTPEQAEQWREEMSQRADRRRTHP